MFTLDRLPALAVLAALAAIPAGASAAQINVPVTHPAPAASLQSHAEDGGTGAVPASLAGSAVNVPLPESLLLWVTAVGIVAYRVRRRR